MNLDTLDLSKSMRRLLLLLLILPMGLLVMGVYGGLMQALFRAGIITSDPFVGGEYYRGLTLHGVINALVFTTFFSVAFGHAVISKTLNKALNAKAAWTSGILMIVGTVMAALTIFAGQADVLYTFYPPLQANFFFYLGLVLVVVGSWIAFFTWIPPYLEWRRENPGTKTPLAAVGIFVTFIVWFIASIAVAVEIIALIMPWVLGWVDGINAMLARTLFWMFGHPLVYFWLLPVYVMYYTMLPRLAGGKLYSDTAGRLVFFMFIVFSIPVGTHHQYMDPGISAEWKLIQGFFTFMVALPSLITAFTLAASLEYAGRKRGGTGLFGWVTKLPYFDSSRWLFAYFISGLVLFIFGGISGIINASYQMNAIVHNTAWLPGHFHMTVAGPVILGMLGMSLYMVAKLTGKKIRLRKMVMAVPYVYSAGLLMMSWGLMRGGLQGMPRRTNTGLTYSNPDSALYRADWQLFTDVVVVGASIMFLAMVVYFAAFFLTLVYRRAEEPAMRFQWTDSVHESPTPVRWLHNFRPWVITAVVLIVLTYAPVMYDVTTSGYETSPRYGPDSPAPRVNPGPQSEDIPPPSTSDAEAGDERAERLDLLIE